MTTSCDTAVYVLTSHNACDMGSMAAVAMLSLRRMHPRFRIVLLVDTTTNLRLQNHPVLQIPDQLMCIDTGISDAPASSRHIKTSLARHFGESFIYLDIDTIVLRPLDALWNHTSAFAATPDGFCRGTPAAFPGAFLEKFKELKWRTPEAPYFSSGVFFVRRAETTLQLFDCWHRLWRESREVMGDMDQPALHEAIRLTGLNCLQLDEKFNTFPIHNLKYVKDVHVFHFTSKGAMECDYFLIHHLTLHFNQTGELDEAALARAARRSDPWIGPGPGIMGNYRTGRYAAALRNGLIRLHLIR